MNPKILAEMVAPHRWLFSTQKIIVGAGITVAGTRNLPLADKIMQNVTSAIMADGLLDVRG